MENIIDQVYGWVWKLGDVEGIIPPFCVELTLKDGFKMYLHSVKEKNEETQSLVLRFWDFRAFDKDDINNLKQKLNSPDLMAGLATPQEIDPKLDWADMHIHIQNIGYAIEWNDKVWPRETRVGFQLD